MTFTIHTLRMQEVEQIFCWYIVQLGKLINTHTHPSSHYKCIKILHLIFYQDLPFEFEPTLSEHRPVGKLK